MPPHALSIFWHKFTRRVRMLLGQRAQLSASRALGERAEQLALDHLRTLGFSPLARNAITRAGEADLLMRCPQGELVVVEVKSRVLHQGSSQPPPELAIDADKLRRLRGICTLFSRKNPTERVRADVVAIDLNEREQPLAIRHYPGVLRVSAPR